MASAHVSAALEAIQHHGVLLLQDALRPSLATMIAGAPVRGTWWSHPAASAIFETASALDEAGDVTTAKLIDHKVTFVHRRLWPALISVGLSRGPWQLQGLSSAAAELLAQVDATSTAPASGAAAKVLQERLLVASEQVHTESGKHVLELCTWTQFAANHGLEAPWPNGADAVSTLEQALAALPGALASPRAKLPWFGRAGHSG